MKRLALGLALLGLFPGCGRDGDDPRADMLAVPGHPSARKTSALARAQRRAYDGAPPVIPHPAFQGECTTCHDERGLEVAGVGFAPPSPHRETRGLSDLSRCAQCHVERQTDELFVANAFVGLQQDLRHGSRAHALAPPVMPHDLFLRENCQACHAGPAAREEIRTSHPERTRCEQCHVPQLVASEFAR